MSKRIWNDDFLRTCRDCQHSRDCHGWNGCVLCGCEQSARHQAPTDVQKAVSAGLVKGSR